jgi:zinc/manganese transport system substrate-binding protein
LEVMPMPIWRALAAWSALNALGLAACGGGGATATTAVEGCRPLRIVATTSILGDVVGQVAGAADRVEVLIPRGADPHSFQASASQAAALREADLVVVNGLGLEGTLVGIVASAAADGVTVVEAASFVVPLPYGPGVAGEDGGEANGGALDPHLWTDPQRMAEVATGLGEALAAADPGCAAAHRAAAAAYRAELLDLDREIEGVLAAVPAGQRKLITNPHTLGYFAARYGFEVVGAILPGGTTFAGPSSAGLAALVETLRREGVRAIFAETTAPVSLADAVAAELGGEVAVVTLYTDSLGEPGSGADTYAGMMRVDARRIAEALGGS